MAELLTDPHAWIAFLTLSALEIVLGIDNIIFFSIVGLTRLTRPLVTVPFFGNEFSGRDIILLLGGLFLLAKSVTEIHETLEGEAGERHTRVFASFLVIVVQIAVIDIVFS